MQIQSRRPWSSRPKSGACTLSAASTSPHKLNSTQRRGPGVAFKPFIYRPALEKGFSKATGQRRPVLRAAERRAGRVGAEELRQQGRRSLRVRRRWPRRRTGDVRILSDRPRKRRIYIAKFGSIQQHPPLRWALGRQRPPADASAMLCSRTAATGSTYLSTASQTPGAPSCRARRSCRRRCAAA